jgi:hypothetical protein
MSLLSKFEAFEKDGVGTFLIKTSRFNLFKRAVGTHVELYYIPEFKGAKPYLIEDSAVALRISQADDAWQAMSIVREVEAANDLTS